MKSPTAYPHLVSRQIFSSLSVMCILALWPPSVVHAQFTYNSGGSVTENSALTGTGNLTVSNSTNLTLTNAGNTFNGSTTIQSGSLLLGNGGASGFIGSTSSITNNGTLVYNLTSSGTLGMVISGIGALVKQSTGTLTLSGSNTYTGATTISVGTLALGASNVIADTSNVSVASGSTFALGGFSDTIGKLSGAGSVALGSGALTTTYGSGSGTFSGVISGNGSFTLAGTADYNAYMTINGSNTYTGSTNVNGATLILGANNVLSNSSALNISGGHFNAGGSTQTLHSLTMTSGLLTRNGGTLRFNNASSLTGGTVNIGNSGGSIVTGGALTLGNVTFTYNASTDGLNALSLGGDVAVGNGGTATMSNGPAGGRGYIKLGDANRVFDVGANANLNVNWVISSANPALGALTKNGSGTLTLNAFNEYTGGTTVNAGTLVLGHATNTLANAGAVTVNGGTLSLGSNNDTIGALTLTGGSITGTTGVLTASSLTLQNGTVSAILAGSASINKTTSGALTLAGNNTLSGGITLSAGQLNLNASGALGSGNFTIQGGSLGNTSGSSVTISSSASQFWNADFTYAGPNDLNLGTGAVAMNATRAITVDSGTLTAGGAISGSGFGLTKNGSGTLALNSINTYTGGTTVNGGTLVLGNATDTLANAGAVTVNGGTLSLGTNNDTIGALTLTGGSITGTTGVLTASSLTLQNGTVSAILAGSASINKTTSGTLTLAGNNTLSGGITLSAGQLNLNASGALGSGNFTIQGGSLGNTSGSSVTISSSASQFWNANFTYAGPNDLNLGTGAVAMNATRAITVDSGTLIAGGAISGSGFGLTKNGTGTLTLSGANSYTSTTTVNAGTLALGASNVIANSSDVVISAGAVLSMGVFNDTIGKLSGAGSVALGSGTLTTTYGSGSGTFSGVISGNGSFTLAGTADYNAYLTISGSNTYTGATNVNGATLILGADNVLSSSSTLNISGGRFSASNRNQTLHSLTMTSGVIERNGGGLTFNNASSLTGGNVNIGNNGGSIITGGTTTLGNVTFTYNATLGGFNALVLGGDVAVGNGSTATMTMGSAGGIGYIKLGNTNRVFDVGADAQFNINWVITSNTLPSGYLTKNGSGTLTLNASNPYTGGTTINAGTLVLGHATDTLANAAAVTVNGGTLSLGSNNDTIGALTLAGGSITGSTGILTASSYALQNGTVSAILAGSASMNKTTSGTLTLSGVNTYTGGTTVNAGTLVLGHATDTLANAGVVTVNGGILSLGSNNDTIGALTLTGGSITGSTGFLTASSLTLQNGTVSAILAGSASINKTTSGILTLAGNNTLSGGIILSAGQLNLNASGALGSGNFTIQGGSLGNTSGSSVTISSSASQFWNADFSYSGPNDLNLGTGTVAMNATRVITVDSGTLTVGGAISGSGFGLTKNGSGTLTLSGNNTYTGATTIAAGTISINAASALASTSSINLGNATSLTYTGGTATLDRNISVTSGTGSLRNTGGGTLTLGGTLSKNGTTLTFAQGAFNVTGSITGSSADSDLVVDSSTVTLNGVNTYDGPTYIINGGTLNANAVGALPTGTLSAVTINGSSTLALGASQSVASLSGTSGSSVNLNANTLTINGSATTTYSGGISGTGNLVKNGSGTQTLAGATTFNGSTTIKSGTLQAATTGALANSTVINVDGGSFLVTAENAVNDNADINLGGGRIAVSGTFNETVGALTLSANSTIDFAGFVGTLRFSGIGSWATGANLAIWNWSGTTQYGTQINNYATPSNLVFSNNSTLTSNLANISFYSDSGNSFVGSGFELSGFSGGGSQIIAVPETETYFYGLALLAGIVIQYLRRSGPQRDSPISVFVKNRRGGATNEPKSTRCQKLDTPF
jgi:autotransporter-associated beta strand protein